MRQLHVEGILGWIQEDIQLFLVVQEQICAINEAGRIEMSKAPHKVAKTKHRYTTSVEHIKTILKFSIKFLKMGNEKISVTWIVNAMWDIMASDLLTKISTQP